MQRVLMVHTDVAVRELAERTLSRMGVELRVVTRGADAVKALDEERYTVAVIDRELCDEILDVMAGREDRPIVICTASAEAQGTLDPAVVSLFVPQPYDAPTLVGVILACVSETRPAPST